MCVCVWGGGVDFIEYLNYYYYLSFSNIINFNYFV